MSPAPPSKRLYLRNLPRYVNHRSLAKHLSSYGKIQEVKMVHDYAFVQFESKKDAQDVVETFRKQSFLGQGASILSPMSKNPFRTFELDIIVEFAHPLRKDTPSLTSNSSADTISDVPLKPRFVSANVRCRYPVVVDNIPRKIRWQELKDFGRIPGGLVAYCDLDRRSQGRGFIEYFSKEDAELAIKELDGRYLGQQRVRVSGRPEVFSRGHIRSRSRGRQAHSVNFDRSRKSRPHEGRIRLEAYYDNYYRHTPPPVYHSEPAVMHYSPPNLSRAPHLTPYFADDRSMGDPHSSYPAADHNKYEEQYDYASHNLPLDAWKYDHEYGASQDADHTAPRGHMARWEQHDAGTRYYWQA